MPSWSYPNQHMPQPQFHETNWNNHLYSSPSQWGYNTPEPYCQPPFQPSSSYTSFPTPPIEEPTYLKKSIEFMIQSSPQMIHSLG